jgi:hypothetical protein
VIVFPFVAYPAFPVVVIVPTTGTGAVLSTAKVVDSLDATDVLPAASLATPAFIVIASVPSPLPVVTVTVGVDVVPPLTETAPAAVPVLVNVTSLLVRFMFEAPAIVTP